MPINSFDFLVGDWKVRHRRLRNPLTGSSAWYELEGTACSQVLFDGAISIDEMLFPTFRNRGLSLRLRNPVDDTWTIYWVNSTDNRLEPPVVGRWDQNGEFTAQGPDEYAGGPILASYHWSDITKNAAQWEQAFSIDDGDNWEQNWVMHWTRT